MAELAGAAIVAVAAVLALVSAAGLHRFSDPLSRAHAAGKAAPIAVVLAAIGAVVHGVSSTSSGRIVLAATVVVLTSPIAVHLLTGAIRRSGWSGRGAASEGPAADGRYRS